MNPAVGQDERDRAFMMRAIELAERGRGRTSPNPVVGAVVATDDLVVGEGCHERYGGPHAEVNALALAGDRARGATLYVTLEPCCVWGHTPPCTDAVLSSGVARVVIATEDANPAVSGRGIAILRERGIEVRTGVLRSAAEAANRPYAKFRGTGLPFVRLKMAASLDGRTAAPKGGPRWVSCAESRDRVHAMRAAADCVMVGVGTVLADDPELTDRRAGAARQPARLVLDAALRTPPGSKLVAGAPGIRTILACGPGAARERELDLRSRGAEIWRSAAADGLVEAGEVLRQAADQGMIDILCEGGPRVASSLLRAGLADTLSLFLAPTLFGSEGLGALGALGPEWRDGRRRLSGVRWQSVGADILVEATILGTDGQRRR